MPLFDEKFLDELISKNNIVDVVGRYCNLVRKGSSHWACCPLPGHTEKTPSFSVNEPGQFYHCFGCGKGGNVIKFIQEVESVDFYDAVKILAERAKMQLPQFDGKSDEEAKKSRDRKERLYKVLRETAIFYAKNLTDERAGKMLEYLHKRGLDAETVRFYGMGASLDYEGLPKHLKKLGFTEKEMLDAGVCQISNGRIYDFQAERLIVPIINVMGQVIAFGGRILEDKGFAKYKNTSETVIFNKKNTLFNINNLKKARQEQDFDFVIMVEGYMDVISLHRAGFKNVVASMGTSLTLSQAKILKRFTNRVLVSYDGDGAGQKATLRSLEIFEKEGFEIKIVNLPDGMDPDDVIKNYKSEGYESLLRSAEPLIDFKLSVIEKDKDLSDVSDKRRYVAECLELIKTIDNEFMKEELLHKVAEKSQISYQSLKRDLENGSITIPKTKPINDSDIKQPIKQDGLSVAERTVLWAYLEDKPYTKKYDLEKIYFSDNFREKIAEEVIFSGAEIKVKLCEVVGEDGLAELNAVLTAGDRIKPEQEVRYFEDCYKVVLRDNLQKDLLNLNELYKNELDPDRKAQIMLLIAGKSKEISSI